MARVDRLSRACEGTAKTHIAALGTQLLAKATDLRADVFALKVKAGTDGAHSARNLAKEVLAAQAPQLGIDLGVTSREPLNNQPYFRYDMISSDMDVKSSARPALEILLGILTEVDKIQTEREARIALRSFLAVRRKEEPPPLPEDSPIPQTTADLTERIEALVSADSEGGRRAQAAAAGLLDVMFGADQVVTSRVNDPDRHLPADVGVLGGDPWLLGLEVRDKPVAEQDLFHSTNKAVEGGMGMITVVATPRS